MALENIKPKLKVDINKNETKKGIKVQFILPDNIMGDEKINLTQKLQSKLNSGLAKFNLTSNIDTDVPYENVIGFLIRIQDIRLMIKNALQGTAEETK
jgi:hypothetical protein